MDIKDWIPIIGTLLGVLIGGFITSFAKWIELRHHLKQEKRKILLSKLEEFHFVVSRFIFVCQEVHSETYHLSVTKALLSPKEQAERFQLISKKTFESTPNLLSNISIYAPELRDDVTEAISKMAEIQTNTIKKIIAENSNQLPDYKELTQITAKLLCKIEEKIKELM